jgi:UDP-glucose 4-epimerase
VLDNFSSGHKEAVKDFPTYEIDLVNNQRELVDVLRNENVEGVVHMASFIQMGESFRDPGKYFRNNLVGAINLFESMRAAGTKYLVFSSSAGVYGNVEALPITEDMPKKPENPYGETKLAIEKMLNWYGVSGAINSIAIRYFNAAGAALDGSVGEDHPNESHIIPLAIKAALTGGEFTVFGNDYKTKDGTCVRDYIHVLDLAEAHVRALEVLKEGKLTDNYNAGTGTGYSNKEILDKINDESGGKLKIVYGARREGDVDALYASKDKIKKDFGWQPKYSDLDTIVKSAWKWHLSHPEGYLVK